MPNSVKNKNIFIYLIMFILLMNMSAANILGTRYVPFFIGIGLFVFNLKNVITFFNKKILLLIFVWLIINGIAVISNSVSISTFRFIIITVNILVLPYLLFQIYGKKIWIVFEQLIYFLTFLSLIIYFFDLLFPDFFISLIKVFIPFTSESFAANPGYYSAFIYVHVFGDNGYGIARNNGFMWEPGGMAMMIIWAMEYNWLQHGLKYNRRFFIYTISLLSTFSTAGYLSLAIIIASKYIKKISIPNVFIIISFALIFYYSFSKLEFVSGKLAEYNEVFQEDKYGESGNIDRKVNRFQGGATALLRTLKQPLGTGLVSAEDLNDMDYSYGVNGIASILEMWGIPVFIFLMIQIYKYLDVMNDSDVTNLSKLFLFFALLIPFFSNPIARFLLVYMIILTPMMGVFNDKRLKVNEQ